MYKANGKKIAAIIEARMASTRLAGKVLLPFLGKPALVCIIERLRHSNYIDAIVLATTVDKEDDVLVKLCLDMGIAVSRGGQKDVLESVLRAAQANSVDVIAEVTADDPLIDPKLVDRCIEEFFENGADYAASESHPLGLGVQVFSTAALAEAAALTNDPVDRAHVSYYIYRHPERYRLHAWEVSERAKAPEYRLTLDEEADYRLLKKVFETLYQENPSFGAEDVVSFLRKNPELAAINKNVRQKLPEEL